MCEVDPRVREFERYNFDKAVDLRSPQPESWEGEGRERTTQSLHERVNIPTSGHHDEIKGQSAIHIPQDDA